MARNFVIGAAELSKLLTELPEKVEGKVVLASLRSGARIISAEARRKLRANPSIDSGALEKRVSTRTRKRRSDRKSAPKVVSVGVSRGADVVVLKRGGKSRKVTPARYAHLVEFGTQNMRAEPFLRPALDEKGPQAIAKVMEMMARGVEREARKMAQKR